MRISDWSSDVCSSDLTHPPETQLKGGSLKGLSEATLLRDVSRPPHLSISVITSSPAGFEADPAPRPGRRRCGGGDGEGDAGNVLINNFIFETGRTAVAEIDVARPAGRSTSIMRVAVISRRPDTRSEERRVGKEGVRKCRSRGSPEPLNKK